MLRLAQNSAGVLHSSTNSLFFVEPTSGDIRANPAISEQPQGVYSVFVNILSGTSKELLQQFVKKFHYVKDDMKMRYVFNTTLEEFARSREEFEKRVQTALSKDHPEGNMEVFLSQPKRDKRISSWTSVCFHTAMNGEVQGERAVMTAMSQSSVENSELSKLYHLYRVINIERCETAEAPVRQSAFALPMQVVILISGVAILILILVTLLTYICFVRRYKEHLRAKQKQLKGNSKAEFYKREIVHSRNRIFNVLRYLSFLKSVAELANRLEEYSILRYSLNDYIFDMH
ncbi:unnamed protein product [Strongylus vulgaris]|uniref:SEA domain-containing protein n=1 Tax=Strongylus vulgaris TaxID=40348 RepID=A0A3P7IDK3_STRVU|nr:unnamed protein product [Strongylus vulgaris]